MFEEMIEHIIPHLRRDIQAYFDSKPETILIDVVEQVNYLLEG